MSTRIGIVLTSVGLVALSCVCVLTLRRELIAARFVPAEIELDCKVIMKGNASDNGDRDADEIWRSASKVKFRLTPDGEKWAAEAQTDSRLLEGKVSLILSHGGSAETKRLTVNRSPKEAGDVHWTVDPTDVNRLFLIRSIPRMGAKYLKDVNAEE